MNSTRRVPRGLALVPRSARVYAPLLGAVALTCGAAGTRDAAAESHDSPRRLVRLNQGWSTAQSEWFYRATQGSQLLPYAFFVNLEQADSQRLFRDPPNMQKYRLLPEPPTRANPDGLAIGIVEDPGPVLPPDLLADRRAVGLTCAACHTMQINYKGTAMRIDGGTALFDIAGFLEGLRRALEETANEDPKFERFASRMLGTDADTAKKAKLRAAVRAAANEHSAYAKRNQSDLVEGFGRADAFGRIYSSALAMVDPKNRHEPDAPVSFPQLWDSTRLDYVQYTAVAGNTKTGPLSRNIGQIIGVFAKIDPGHPPPTVAYDSSVRLKDLRRLEGQLKRLKSPVWPEDILPPIDREKAAQGREIFATTCRGCHHDNDRDSRSRIHVTKVPISRVKTDPRAAENLKNTRGSTGFLAGTKQRVLFGKPFGATDTAFHITANTILHVLLGKLAPGTRDNPMHHALLTVSEAASVSLGELKNEPQLQYKARPLNGIWSTGPFLHNGSVPTLFEMISPAETRTKRFAVGRRDFDPVRVGLVTEPTGDTFLFDTSLPGNRNTGHPFGNDLTDAERWQVVEYLKTL